MVGDALYVGGERLPGRCADYSVDNDPFSPFLRLEVTLIIERQAAAPPVAPAFVDDGGQHFTSTFPGGRVTPSGKNACVRCGEAWPCSTALHRDRTRGSYAPPVDNSSGAPLE